MDAAFPRMKSLYYQSPTGPTECQDLLGMTFRAEHFDGLAHVPGYVDWVIDCDMAPAYRYHRRTLQLLQWKCPPYTWHLKTPVHMLSLDALDKTYPDARLIWSTALRRAMAFRERVGEERFADLGHAGLQTDPLGALEQVYERLDLPMSDAARSAMRAWVSEHPGRARDTADYDLARFALDTGEVRETFGFYLDRFDIPVSA
jgi:hypothetical protein